MRHLFFIITILWIIAGCKDVSGRGHDLQNGKTVNIPLESHAWKIQIREYRPYPAIMFRDGKITIIARAPKAGNYPGVKMWVKDNRLRLKPDTPFTMEVQAKVDVPGLMANAAIGWNSFGSTTDRHNHSFQHFHLSMGSGTFDYRADWSENQCFTGVPVDQNFHTYKIKYDGDRQVDYFIDGVLCLNKMDDSKSQELRPNDYGLFTIYFERYPTENNLAETYEMEIRKFAVTFN